MGSFPTSFSLCAICTKIFELPGCGRTRAEFLLYHTLQKKSIGKVHKLLHLKNPIIIQVAQTSKKLLTYDWICGIMIIEKKKRGFNLMTQLLIIFILLSIVNVILNTLKSILTVNGGKFSAALINAITFFVYTYVIIYTNCELSMHLKAIVTAIINFIGVYIVKYFEEKSRKDKLWKIEVTIPRGEFEKLKSVSKDLNLSFNFIDIDKYVIFNYYVETQYESQRVKDVLNCFKGVKYFVSETKIL